MVPLVGQKESENVEVKEAPKEEVKADASKDVATIEEKVEEMATPSVLKDIPVSKAQEEALQKIDAILANPEGEGSQAQATSNETPSLIPGFKPASKMSGAEAEDIEAKYMQEVNGVPNAQSTEPSSTSNNEKVEAGKANVAKDQKQDEETRKEAGVNSPKV